MSTRAPDRTGIHARQVGEEGERIVFLHGLFGQGRNFTQAATSLAPDFTSLLVDLPDHGRSAWSEHFDYADAADKVATFLRAGFAAKGPVHVVGHSMGGKVAMVLALRHADLVERLVVVDIAPAASEAAEFEHLLASLAAVDLASLARRSDADAQLREAIPHDRVRGFLLQNLRSGDDGYTWRANLSMLRRDLAVVGGFPPVEGTFDGPVLWMAGERSDYVRPDTEATMRELFPRTTLVTIKDAGHWVHSEQPAAFVSALRVFLSAD